MNSEYYEPWTPGQKEIFTSIKIEDKPIYQLLTEYYQNKMKEKLQCDVQGEKPFELSKPSLEEQIGDLNKRVRQLMLRIERLESHTHDNQGKAVCALTRI